MVRLSWRNKTPKSVIEAREEADDSERRLHEIQSQRAEAMALARKGREQRKRNHFGESIYFAMKRRHA